MGEIRNTPEAWSKRARLTEPWDAAGWSVNWQTRRFLAVADMLTLREGDTLLDYGCGPAEFSSWVPDGVDYYGFDWAEGMLERAERRGVSVFRSLPETLFDHVIAVGTFNLADNWSRERTWDTLALLWAESVRRTLVVSLYRGDDARCITYGPAEAIRFLQLVGCRDFRIDCDYLPNDFALAMHR